MVFINVIINIVLKLSSIHTVKVRFPFLNVLRSFLIQFKAPIPFYGYESNIFLPLSINPLESKRTYPIALRLANAHIIPVQGKHGARI